jgi:hypothetical protein
MGVVIGMPPLGFLDRLHEADRAPDIDIARVIRVLPRNDGERLSGEMENPIRQIIADPILHRLVIADIEFEQTNIRLVNLLQIHGGVIVRAHHLIALIAENFDKMGANHASRAGNICFHCGLF